MTSLEKTTLEMASRAKVASRLMVTANGQQKTDWLRRSAELIHSRQADLMSENARDIEKAPEYNLTPAATDRLRLTSNRLDEIATALEQVALLPDPIGEIFDSNVRPNGMLVTRVRVPLGVVFFIYESRPNVTVDAASLCVKSGNAVILRGGKEAFFSNHALHRLLSEALESAGLPTDAVQLVETTDRAAVGHFLRMNDLIDVTIPRGGKSLIERVTSEATMPVIKHFDGNCHVYVDRDADFEMAQQIVINSKCQRTGVCNTAETLLVHQDIAAEFLQQVGPVLKTEKVELRCCENSRNYLEGSSAATDEDFRTEFLDLIMSVKTVANLQEAIDHINEYGSGHTDAIVTNSLRAANEFTQRVDSAAVHVNVSTRLSDGSEFGLGAEIGISTDKFHARGPCGLRELTSYKYVVHGDGQLK